MAAFCLRRLDFNGTSSIGDFGNRYPDSARDDYRAADSCVFVFDNGGDSGELACSPR